MPTFYVAAEAEGFKHECVEVKAHTMEWAAKEEASRLFDDNDVDQMRPVEVIVARTRDGEGAVRYSVSRVVTVEHHIEAEEEVDVTTEEDED